MRRVLRPDEGPWVLLTTPKGKPRLAWGSHENAKRAHALGYQALTLCAEELQDRDGRIKASGIAIVRCPMDDNAELPDRASFRKRVTECATMVTEMIRRGLAPAVLVTCHLGQNRSALMAAAIAHLATGESGKTIVTRMRGLRPEALNNTGFRRWVESWPRVR